MNAAQIKYKTSWKKQDLGGNVWAVCWDPNNGTVGTLTQNPAIPPTVLQLSPDPS